MFRVARPFAATFLAALIACLPILVTAADAGQVRYRHKGSSGSISYNMGSNVSGHRVRKGRNHHGPIFKHARKGWKKFRGRDFDRFARTGRDYRSFGGKHYGRRGYDDGAENYAGSVSVASGREVDNGSSGAVIVNGRCAAGQYCTLRLGSSSSAPKIITLNGTGKTIEGELFD